jgi:hypothetical protein
MPPLILAFLFLLVFGGLLFFFMVRVRAGDRPTLRRIRGFEVLKGLMGRSIETGRTLHLSVGVGSMANQTTADSLAGLSVLNYLTRQAAETGIAPTVSMADPTVMLFAQNTIRRAYPDNPTEAEEAYRHVRWIAPQPAAYAAGVMNILSLENAEANVMVGNFGDEYLLMGEAAAWRNLDHVGGASNPNTLPFIYVTAQETLLGEEIYAAGAYLERIPAHIGSLVTQDAMRWLVAMIIIGGILVATFKLAWLWLIVAALGLIILVSIVRGSLR